MKMTGKIRSKLMSLAITLSAVAGLSSCNDCFIYEDEGDCTVTYRLQFVYDMNLKWADAFPSEVKSVNLYAFDTDGIFVREFHDAGEALSRPGYRMTLDLPYGDYRLVAWCGLENAGAETESFTVPSMVVGESTITDLTCSLNAAATRAEERDTVSSDRRLYFLYHGMISEASLIDTADGKTYDMIMYLTKDTNHLRVILQELSGEKLDPEEFEMTIEAADRTLAYNNDILGNTVVAYTPWALETTEMEFERPDGVTDYNYGVSADFSTSRLMASQKNSTYLTIRHSGDGEIIARVPVVQYALLAREYYEMAYDHPMTEQEFLDREDEYEITFFLSGSKWISSYIMINSWRIVLHDYDLQ